MAYDKLVDSTQLNADLTSVANAIRTKGGTSDTLAFPSGYVNAVNALPQMTGELAWMGKDIQQVSGEFYSSVKYLKSTAYNGWSPSSTAKAIISSSTLTAFSAADLDQWAYYIVWECGVNPVYTGSPTDVGRTILSRGLVIQEIIRKPGTWAAIEAGDSLSNINQSAYAATLMRYYNDKGSLTYTWTASYGFYVAATAPGVTNTTANTTNITPKTPVFNARTSNTYLSVANANLIDQNNTVIWIKGTNIYRAKHDTFFDGVYKRICKMVTATPPTVPTT